MMVRWQIHLEPENHAAVQMAAHALGISSAEFVRRAVRRELDRHQAARELAPVPAASNTGEHDGYENA
jgi:hypothetical protein